MATVATQLNSGSGFASGEIVTATKLNNLVNTATVTGIVNADIDAAAAIALSKINLGSGITDAQLATGAVTGAAGGGKLAASAITGQTLLADPLASGDEFIVHDTSASALRRVAWSSIQPAGTVLQTAYDDLVGVQSYTSGQTLATTTTSPTITSGVEILRIDGVATSSNSNYLIIDVSALVSSSAGGASATVMLFAGSTLLASTLNVGGNNNAAFIRILFKHSPGNTSSVNYTVRAAVESGTLQVNRLYSINDYNTGKQVSSMLIQEIKG